jgi:cell wall-associated NlpC family hydrolase
MFDDLRDLVVGAAQSCIGTPYVPRGHIPGLALDCGTLLKYCYGPGGLCLRLPAFPSDYPSDWATHTDDHRYLDFIMPFVTEVRKPIRGGISLWHYGRSWSHGTIVVDRKNVIHAWGRQAFGCVQRSHISFFTKKDGTPRDVKHFDLKPELWESALP